MARKRDFFISYTKADEGWAEWIAHTLSQAKYTLYFQKWDFRPGGNFVLQMHKAAQDSKRTLLVLSPNFLSALYTQPEWAAALADDPTGKKRSVLPVRIEPCEPAGMLRAIVYCDLVGLNDRDARTQLLAALKPSGRSREKPEFPGKAKSPVSYPGSRVSMRPATRGVRASAEELRAIFVTTRETFVAQAELRNELADRIRTRLRVRKHHEYEELFDLYFKRMKPDELRLHRIIRGYTESILHEYNERALQIVNDEPLLARFLPSLLALRQHLLLWLNKFDSVFLKTPSMCLLYVGVEEDRGFPREIEKELERYLAGAVRTAKPSKSRTSRSRSRRMSARQRMRR